MAGFLGNLLGDVGKAFGLTSNQQQQPQQPQQITSNLFSGSQPQSSQFGNWQMGSNAADLHGSDSTPESASGTHASDGAVSDGGWTGKIEDFLQSPLTQGLAGMYFNAISAPKHTSLAGRIGLGGLGGLQAFNQAELQKAQLPYQEAQLAQLKAQTKQTEQATQLGARKLAPVPDSMIQQADQTLQHWQQVATNPPAGTSHLEQQEAQTIVSHIQQLKSLAADHQIDPETFMTAMDAFDPAKIYGEIATAGKETALGQLYQFGSGMITTPDGVTVQLGTGAADTGGTGAAAAPTAPAAPPSGPIDKLDKNVWNVSPMKGGGGMVRNKQDGRSYVYDNKGQPHQVDLTGINFPVDRYGPTDKGGIWIHKKGDGAAYYVKVGNTWQRIEGGTVG